MEHKAAARPREKSRARFAAASGNVSEGRSWGTQLSPQQETDSQPCAIHIRIASGSSPPTSPAYITCFDRRGHGVEGSAASFPDLRNIPELYYPVYISAGQRFGHIPLRSSRSLERLLWCVQNCSVEGHNNVLLADGTALHMELRDVEEQHDCCREQPTPRVRLPSRRCQSSPAAASEWQIESFDNWGLEP